MIESLLRNTANYFATVAVRALPLVPVFFCVDNYIGTVKLVGGRSMQPTFNSRGKQNNDAVVLDRWTARTLAYRRGDVVVLRSPHEPEEMLTKRVIGLPGDWVRPRAEVAAMAERARKAKAAAEAAAAAAAASSSDDERGEATADGSSSSYSSSSAATAAAEADDDEKRWRSPLSDLVHVPRGQLWVEGDNEASSNDSNGFGCVAAALVEARVCFKLWPINEAGVVERREPSSERLVIRGACEKMDQAVATSKGMMPWHSRPR